MESEREMRTKFLKAIEGDSAMGKLWKYRSLIHNYPKEAVAFKDKMLELALKHKLIGEYELIHQILGVAQGSISRSGDYGQLKNELVPAINNLKIEADNYESVVRQLPLRVNQRRKSGPTSNSEKCFHKSETIKRASSSTLASSANRQARPLSVRRNCCPPGDGNCSS